MIDQYARPGKGEHREAGEQDSHSGDEHHQPLGVAGDDANPGAG